MSAPTTGAVVGGGTMGVGIAYVMAVAGLRTTVVEPSPERADLKQQVLAAIESRSPRLLATNTSSMSVDALAAGLQRPADFLGLHFFNPVWSIPVVEVVRGAATGDDALQRGLALVDAIGKQSAVVRDSPGFATSRLDLVLALESMRMLEEGVAEAADIDRAVKLAYRHPVGPLTLSDIVGLDVRLDISRQLETSLGERFAAPQILVDLVEQGRLGQKTGHGFFDWT